MPIELNVNGQKRTIESETDRTLLEVLREDLQLTGTKYGCGEAQCGACSVLLDGKRVFSCQTSLDKAAGKQITTIEGLMSGEKLHPVQQAFMDESGYQCGYCTPGMIIAAVALLSEKPKPSEDEIVAGMNRNLCRCCGYGNIVNAVKKAAAMGGAK